MMTIRKNHPKQRTMDVENDDNKEESPKTEKDMDVENDDNKEESPKTENMDVENDDTKRGITQVSDTWNG